MVSGLRLLVIGFLYFCSLQISANPNVNITLDSLLSIKEVGNKEFREGNYQKSLITFELGRKLNQTLSIDSLEAHFLYHIGLCNYYLAQYGLSIDNYEQALKVVDQKEQLIKRKRLILWGQAISYQKVGNYIEALKTINIAINITNNDNPFKVNFYIIEGNLHQYLKQDSLAINSYQNAYNIYYERADTLRMSMALNNIGISYKNLQNYDQALDYFNQALVLKRLTNNKKKVASTLYNIGGVLIIQHRYQEAKPYLIEALQIREELDNRDLSNSLNRIGNLYLGLNQPIQAKSYLDRAKALLDSTDLKSKKMENFYLLSKYYYLQGNNNKGDDYHLLYSKLRDELYSELDVSQSILESERERLAAEKERAVFEAQNEVLEQKSKFQQYQLVSSLVIIIALAALGWNLHRSRNMKKRLAEELNHRTKNNFQLFMSMLGYQKRRFKEVEMQNLLNEIQNRMSAMASVHRLLKPQKSLYKVNMQEYIDKILGSICYSFGYSADALNLVIPPIEMSMKRANYIGFIVNEVATNSFKYAFPQSENPELHVTLLKEDGKFHLFIQDNGKEIPPHDPNKSTSLGKTLIEDFTHNLKGKSNYEHTGEGMLFQLEFSV